jgi:NagD protein
MFLIDVQGTLIDDKDRLPIDGAVEFIDILNSKNIPYVIITNNTKHRSEDFFKSLVDMGFNIDFKNYLDPFTLLQTTLKSKKVVAFGQDNFLNVLDELGYVVTKDDYEALVVSISKEYTNEDYSSMIEAAIKVDEIIGMHETSLYAKDGRRYPGVGAIMKMVEFASNKPYKVVGKPSRDFYSKAKEMLKAKNFQEIIIISDDMIGDLLGAKELGMRAVFVLSGKIKDANEIIPTLKEEQKPDLICKNMKEVIERIKL